MSFNVTAAFYIENKFIEKDYACWSMCKAPILIDGSLNKKNYNYMKGKFIYISNFDDPNTSQYQKLLLSTINEITRCKIIKKNNKKYIKFRLLSTYDQSLILLNFIRNLWHNPVEEYRAKFFITLSKAKHKDALERLTAANKEACPENLIYPPGHSNVFNKTLLKIKNTKDLFNFKGYYIYDFFTK